MATNPSPRRRSGAQFVYEELLDRIQDMRLEPGRRLNEAELATSLGVSRTPLREALRLLLAEELLEQLPTGGMVVRRLTPRDAAELYAVRARLEGLVAAAAAERAEPADVDRLMALLHRNEALAGLANGAMESGHAIHVELERIADHAWASRVLAQIEGQLARYRRFSNASPERREAALAEHRSIIEAVAAGDPALAGALAEEHVLAAREVTVAELEVSLGPSSDAGSSGSLPRS
ncbi:GntR family transcriptional regulator [Knoellia flava TL1]|uniref:GntR family transcriptional regulator n=2 Tax=Knoellia flava TaxID=913969 RepID=A0A8H9FVV1_9MICO|nr:GntR family transcriptional regulator [Knoellia flava]KGN28769.1 GntR family transcriptional regulator [Knoellia flava TL1]GGB85390.1 GntR family transcriptional regulator [Knoellia flava]